MAIGEQTDTAGTKHADRPVVDFDHHRDSAPFNPEEAYAELRSRCPVAWSDHHGGFWVVSRHEDVARVLKDYKSFSSARNDVTGDRCPIVIPPAPLELHVPEEIDPPEFQAYRRLLNGVLAPTVVHGELSERVRYWIDWHIDQIIESGECDLVNDLTSPIAGGIALDWLGFPRQDWPRIIKNMHGLASHRPGSPESIAAAADIKAFEYRRIAEEIALRQQELSEGHSRGDVMAYLVAQEIDGKPISTEKAESMVRLLIAGGVDTTTSATSSALVHLHFNRDQRQQLIDDEGLWSTAVEEFLRRYPPIMAHARTVVNEVEIGGYTMQAGERILASEASACWDEAEFLNADEVILDRFPNRHLAFGLGVHRCPGMHLARLTFRLLVSRVLERMPDYEVVEAGLRRYPDQSAVAGWATAPAFFTPGPRVIS